MNRKRSATMVVVATFAAATVLAQNGEQEISRTFDVGNDGELSLSNVSGDIHVEGTSGTVITLHATKTLRGRADRTLLDEVEVDISQTSVVEVEGETPRARVRVETRYPRDRRRDRHHDHGGVSVSYRVTVPVGTYVEVDSVSGNVRVSGVHGETSATSVSGSVDVDGTPNLVRAKSVSGDVNVRNAGAERDLEIGSVSGQVDARGLEADELDVSSVSGDVTLNDVRCDNGEFDSVSGDIRYTGRISRGGRYEFKSHSGDVVITIGDDIGFELEASTFSGDVESDFSMRVSSLNDRGRNLSAVVGDGSAVIEATTFSGDVELRRR